MERNSTQHSMKDIKIFVAGSTELEEYREKLVLWANGKNFYYQKHGLDYHLHAFSFREVGDNQEDYNRYIQEEADIALFIITNEIGEKTKKELRKAKESLEKDHHPTIYIFTNQNKERINSFLEGLFEDAFSIRFKTVDDFLIKVNSRIDEYVRKLSKSSDSGDSYKKDDKGNSNGAGSSNNNDGANGANKDDGTIVVSGHHAKRWGFIAAVLAALFILAGWALGRYTSTLAYQEPAPVLEQPDTTSTSNSIKLIIAGGGSVANFIEKQDNKITELEKYPNGYYLHVPTGVALTMMLDELISPQYPTKYYPICISAKKAKETDFMSNNIDGKSKSEIFQEWEKKVIIVGCKLGEDPLVIYANKHFSKENTNGNKKISTEELKELILDTTKCTTFTTSKGSGTRFLYLNLMGINNDTLEKCANIRIFTEKSSYVDLQKIAKKKSFIALGSKYYAPVRKGFEELSIENANPKELYLYFIAKKIDRGYSNQFYIPKETRQFLKDIKARDLLGFTYQDSIIQIQTDSIFLFHKDKLVKEEDISK